MLVGDGREWWLGKLIRYELVFMADQVTPDNYHIIHNMSEVKDFMATYIPTDPALCISPVLFARRKYCETLQQSEHVLQRLFISGGSSPESATRKLLRLQTLVGSYVDRDDETPIPNMSLCVYAIIRPKNSLKALSSTARECMDALIDGQPGRDPRKLYDINIGKNEYSSTDPQHKYTQIDVDTKDQTQLEQVQDILEQCRVRIHITSITETRGGYHIVYRKSKKIDHKRLHDFGKTTAFKKLAHDGKQVTDHWFSQTNQPLVIIPGTYQGGFKAKACPVSEFFSK